MLFNSYTFIFAFLPIALLGFFSLGSRGLYRVALAWITGCSLFFYGWLSVDFLWLIISSIGFNFFLTRAISERERTPLAKWLTALGVITNLGLLGYFKYTNFLVENLNAVFGASFEVGR